MPVASTNPLVVDGVEYPYYGVTIMGEPSWEPARVGARVVVALWPYRIDEQGQIQRPMVDGYPDDSRVRRFVYGDAYEAAATDPALAAALSAIMAGGVQGFVTAKGL